MVNANYVVLKRSFFLESSSSAVHSWWNIFISIFSSEIPTSFFSPLLLRQLKLKITCFFSSSHKNWFLYSLLLLFSCFESIFILNTDTEKKMYTENELDEGWKVSVFNSATRLTEHLTLYRVIFFGKWRRRKIKEKTLVRRNCESFDFFFF